MANQDLRFRRRVTTVGDQPKKNLPVLIALAASAAIIVPALIYTALHPANVSSTIRQIAKHMPMPPKQLAVVSVVASRTTPTPLPSPTPTAASSPTPAAKPKLTTAEAAHLAHLKRARLLAAAAPAAHAKKVASNGQLSDVSGSSAGNTVDSTGTGSTGVTSSYGAQANSAGAAAAPAADATPVYAPEMVVEARFVHQAQPDYPDIAKEQNAQGTAVVLATIGPNGNVLSTRIDQSTGNKLLDAAALAAARQSTFEPPMINGKPATETYRLVYTFAL